MTRQRRWSAIALIAGVLILIVGISRLPTIRASSVVGGSATKSPITSSVPTATVLRPPVPSVSSVDIEPKGAIDLLTTPLPIDNNDTILVDRTCTRLGSGTVTLGVHMVNLGQAQVVIDSVVPEQPLMVLSSSILRWGTVTSEPHPGTRYRSKRVQICGFQCDSQRQRPA